MRRLLNYSWYHCFALLASLLISVPAFAQDSWRAAEYNGISGKDKVIVFLDNFDNNLKDWDLSRLSSRNEYISEGNFHCTSYTSYPYTKRRAVAIDATDNFEIEARMRFAGGPSSNLTGLAFGRDYAGSQYQFLFSPRGRVQVSRENRGRPNVYFDAKIDEGVSKYGYQILTIRKITDKWYFFVNRKLVHEMSAQKLYGNQFGFIIGGNMEVNVDYFRVSEIRARDSKGPELALSEPTFREDQKVFTFTQRHQYISGTVSDESGVANLSINGTAVTVGPDGSFLASLTLPDYQIQIDLQARDAFGNITERQFFMQYVPYVPPAPSAKNYLLVIGINQYTYWNPLHNAVKDCEDLVHTLTTYYEFEPENVKRLYNHEASRERILETLENLQKNITTEDNLLIYYAGHGFYNQSSELGYWVPTGARMNKVPDYIPNSTIHDYLRTIDTKNTFLIADACYAGSLFAKTRGEIVEGAKSRWAFTSGDIQKVWDGQPGENSPFARYLINFLRNFRGEELRANDLIKHVSRIVEQNTSQTPIGSPLKIADDEGGIFTFLRRR
ncbi:MAG: caspase family protein [Bacteroidota bacterium]